jgi:hypothetical protein
MLVAFLVEVKQLVEILIRAIVRVIAKSGDKKRLEKLHIFCRAHTSSTKVLLPLFHVEEKV